MADWVRHNVFVLKMEYQIRHDIIAMTLAFKRN